MAKAVVAAFRGVEARPDLGKGVAWPAAPPSLQPFIAHCKRVCPVLSVCGTLHLLLLRLLLSSCLAIPGEWCVHLHGTRTIHAPNPPDPLAAQIHTAWRRKLLARKYTPEQIADMKKKCLAQDLLGGRRVQWGLEFKWEGHYIAKTPMAAKFGEAVTPLFAKYGDKKVRSADGPVGTSGII